LIRGISEAILGFVASVGIVTVKRNIEKTLKNIKNGIGFCRKITRGKGKNIINNIKRNTKDISKNCAETITC